MSSCFNLKIVSQLWLNQNVIITNNIMNAPFEFINNKNTLNLYFEKD